MTNMLMGYWFMWVQLTLALPLAGKAISGTNDVVSWIYGLQSGISVVLQYPLMRFLERRFPPMVLLIVGIVCMACGLGSVAFVSSLPALLGCVALFAIGSIITAPTQQTVTASLAHPAALGSYFGVSSLALALGGALGNFSGGALYGLGQHLHIPALPWLVFWLIGSSSACGLALLYYRQKMTFPSSL